MKWDENDPIHKEIMEAAKQGFIEKNSDEIRAEIARIKASLPWWLRWYINIRTWLGEDIW